MEIIKSTGVLPVGAAVALGAFDGIHTGHRKLIDNVVEYARINGCKSCVFTFDMLPSGARRIISTEQRNNILEIMGVDYLYIQHFDSDFKSMTADDFMNRFLKQAVYITVGFNFRFGTARQGSTETLSRFCIDNCIKYDIVEPVKINDEIVSCTKIRKYIENADFNMAHKMLGSYFSVEGTVIHGNEIGRTIGFPTANICVDTDRVMPKEGVYVTATEFNGRVYKSFTNYGGKPTFNDNRILVETSIFDFDGDLYGRSIKVYFLEKIRDIDDFRSVDALKAQLEADKNKSLDFFSKNGLQMKINVV